MSQLNFLFKNKTRDIVKCRLVSLYRKKMRMFMVYRRILKHFVYYRNEKSHYRGHGTSVSFIVAPRNNLLPLLCFHFTISQPHCHCSSENRRSWLCQEERIKMRETESDEEKETNDV